MKKLLRMILVMVFCVLTSVPAFAGEWKFDTASGEKRWWYAYEDGTYASNGWDWLDGNLDGTQECYYFDNRGYMLSGTDTPDGYTVNEDGAWTESGIVRSRNVEMVEGIAQEGTETMIPMTIQVGERQFEAALFNNTSTQALISQMPLTINMGEMNGNEKYYYLSTSLPTNTSRIGRIYTGDIMLYGSDCLVLFYEDFNTSYRYTRLGSVLDISGLALALGRGNVEVRFSSGK